MKLTVMTRSSMLAILAAFAVSACGGSDKAETKTHTPKSAEARSTKTNSAASTGVHSADKAVANAATRVDGNGEGITQAAASAKDAINDAGHAAKDTMIDAGSVAKDALADAGHAAKDKMTNVGSAAKAKVANIGAGAAATGASVASVAAGAVNDTASKAVSSAKDTMTAAKSVTANAAEEVSEDATTLSGDAAKGKRVYARCLACHAVQEGVNRIGPSLYGVVGRDAGAVEGFKYSSANENSGIVWTEANLAAFLDDPQGFMPGTKMIFPGLPKEQDRADVIAYLKSVTE